MIAIVIIFVISVCAYRIVDRVQTRKEWDTYYKSNRAESVPPKGGLPAKGRREEAE